MAALDLDRVKGNDRYVAGGAVVVLVLSFLPWYTVTVSGPAGSLFGGFGTSGSVSAWHSYGLNKLAVLLALVAGALVIARLMGALDQVTMPVGVHLATLAASALATLLLVVRLAGSFHSQRALAVRVSAHPGWAWYAAIVVSAAMTYFALLGFQASGEQVPQLPTATPPPPPPPAPPAPDLPPS